MNCDDPVPGCLVEIAGGYFVTLSTITNHKKSRMSEYTPDHRISWIGSTDFSSNSWWETREFRMLRVLVQPR